MQTSTVAEVVRQKNLSQMPVMDYREENGKAVIEIQLQEATPAPPQLRYDAEKMIAVLRSMQFSVGYPTNVTKDIRRERDTSPSVSRPRRKSKKE